MSPRDPITLSYDEFHALASAKVEAAPVRPNAGIPSATKSITLSELPQAGAGELIEAVREIATWYPPADTEGLEPADAAYLLRERYREIANLVWMHFARRSTGAQRKAALERVLGPEPPAPPPEPEPEPEPEAAPEAEHDIDAAERQEVRQAQARTRYRTMRAAGVEPFRSRESTPAGLEPEPAPETTPAPEVPEHIRTARRVAVAARESKRAAELAAVPPAIARVQAAVERERRREAWRRRDRPSAALDEPLEFPAPEPDAEPEP